MMRTITDFSDFELGRTREVVEVQTSAANRNAVVRMLGQARRSVEIFSRDLDNPVYDDSEVTQTMRALVVGSARAQVRILVNDPSRIVTQGHRLVLLAQRVSSFVEIRRVAREHATFNTALFLADRTGTIVRRFADRYDGEVCFLNPRVAHEYGEQFDDMWSASLSDPSLRSLHL